MKKEEIYGFIGWIGTAAMFVVYLVWAFCPDATLRSFGISYYPNKYWAVALPCYFCVLFVTVQIVYQGINIVCCPSFKSYNHLQDNFTRRGMAEGDGIPEIADIPIPVVNKVLYGDSKQQKRRRPRSASPKQSIDCEEDFFNKKSKYS